MLQGNTRGTNVLTGRKTCVTELVSALSDEIKMEVPLIDAEVLFAAASGDFAATYDSSNGLFLAWQHRII